uniref:Immunoglobulin superfamily member 10 n=1 Tax=Leptobrachium leishanense TaxID=445787 RepID=A0A8C5MHJ5_9ANUR
MKPAWRCYPYHLGIVLSLLLVLLPNSSTACPKPCACYVPTEVHCTFRYLTVIPKQIQAQVERINLGYNSLSRLEENDFSGLQKLELLMLHSNEIQTIHERSFNDLSSLQVLKMSYNKVKSLHNNTFHGLKKLVRLHMDHNKLEFLHPDSFYDLTSLKLVHLEGNLLSQLHTDTFVTLRYIQIFKTSSIKQIYLSGNQLSSLPKEMFLYMNDLEGVYLHDNPWSCDCNLQWLTDGTLFKDLIKCKKDRTGQQCPLCSTPRKNKGKSLTDISSQDLSCLKPTIENIFKIKNVTIAEDGGFTTIYSKDFVAPMGSLILNMTDNSGNEANLACSVQRPTKMSQITVDIKPDYTIMRTSFSSFLVCSIDYDHIQKLWGILAMYSDSPMKLKRDLLLTKTPYISYKYRQSAKDDEVFTDIEAELRAEPNWLMQDSVTLQLDRTSTTLSTLHIRYLADIFLTIPKTTEKPTNGNWVMITKSNKTRTEYSALIGGTVEMDCQVLGEPTPAIEWILPDGTKLRAPYLSEEGRITLTKSGKFILKAADRFDTGVYHCIATNYVDADILSFRITVVSAEVEEDDVNGAELTVSNGDELFLPCGSNGIPDASVSWVLPDQSVLHDKSQNKLIFSNGTLKIQALTQRDRGHFRCLAANQYGIDTLIYKVTVKNDKKLKIHHQNVPLDNEGSGKEEVEDINIHSATGKAITHRKLPIRNRLRERVRVETDINGNEFQKRGNINKRIRGQRRQFIQNSRKIDPQRWSEILKKTKQNSINDKKDRSQENKVLVKEDQDIERVSGELEEASGEELLPVEEKFLVVTTKHSTLNILNAMTTPKALTDSKTTSWTKSERSTTLAPRKVIPTIYNENIENTLTSVAPTTVKDLTLETTHKKSKNKPDTLTQTTTENFHDVPTTHSFLNNPLKNVIAKPTSTSRTLHPTPTVIANTYSQTFVHVKDWLTTTIKSLTETPQHFLDPASAVSQYKETTFPTTMGYIHTTTQPKMASQTSTVTNILGTSQGTLNSLVTTSSHLNISSENAMKQPPLVFSVNPTSTPNNLLQLSQEIIKSNPTTSSYFDLTSKSVLRKPNTQPISTTEISSKSPVTYTPLTSPKMITNLVVIEDKLPTTLFHPKDLLTTENLKLQTPVYIPSSTKTGARKAPIATTSPDKVTTAPTTIPDTKYSIATITDDPTSDRMLHPRVIPLVKPEEQDKSYADISGGKGEIEETNIFTIDSSTQSSSKLFVSQSEIGPIYIHSTQKIISPKLSAGSTIITHQQIQIVKNVTPLVPIIRRYGRRRIPGKRKIIRPDKIPNIRVHKYNLVKNDSREYTHGITDQTMVSDHLSTCIPPTVAPSATSHNTDVKNTIPPKRTTQSNVYTTQMETLTPPLSNTMLFSTTKDNADRTSQNSYSSSSEYFKMPLTVSADNRNKIEESNFISSTITTESTPVKKKGTISNYITSYFYPTQKIPERFTQNLKMSSSRQINDPQSTTQISSTVASINNIESIGTTTPTIISKTRNASRILRRKIPWHKLFGKNQIIQREIFRKLKKHTQPMSTVTTPIATVPSTSPSRFKTTLSNSQTSNIHKTTPNTTTSRPFKRHDTTMKDIVSNTFSRPLITAGPTTPESATNTMLTIAYPTSSVTATMTARQKFLRRKRPRKNNLINNSVFTNPWKPSSKNASINAQGVSQPSILKTNTLDSLGEITTTFAVTQVPQLFVDSEQQTTTSVVNDIPQTTKRFSWSKSPSSSKVLQQPLAKINKVPNVIPSTNAGSENSYVATMGNQPTRDNIFRYTQSNPRVTTLKSDIVPSSISPAVTSSTRTSKRYESVPRAIKPVIVKQKTTTNRLTERLHPKSDVTAPSATKPPNPLKPSPINEPSSAPTNYEDKGSLDTTSFGLQNVEPTLPDVPSKPKIFAGKTTSFTVLANSDASVPCEANGNPIPTILWTKVSSGMFASKTRRGNRMEVLSNGSLSILSVSVQDRGQYLCVATNKHGSDRLLVTLYVITYPPKVLQAKSREITVHTGIPVHIKCQAEGRPFPTITWILANETVASESPMNNSKAFVEADGTLTIKEVTIYDRGIYKCLATNIAGVDTSTVRIQVIAAPPVILENKRQTVLAVAGENLKLPCTARGNPHPGVHWVAFDGTKVKPLQYVNVKLFLFSNGTLYLRNIASTDSGNYECIATSSTGSERRVVTLMVQQRDTIPKIVSVSPKATEINFGDKLLLNCTATGEPKPRLMWRLPSKAVVDQWHRMGNRIHVFPNGSLLVDSVTEKDSGDYLCVARNKIGEDLILMKVGVTMKPAKITQKLHLIKEVPYGKDFKVDCKASGSPLPEISWSLPDGTVINNVLQADDSGRRKRRYILFDNGTLYLNKVSIAEEGDYTCYAQNTLGKDEMKVHITVVKAAPRIQMSDKSQYVARAVESVVLHCEAVGEPKPKIFWLLPSSDMIAASHDRYVLHENGSLTVNQLKLLDAGEYMCVARNPAGDDTKLLKLEVQPKPPVINGLYTNKTIIKDTALKHSRKFINCKAEGTSPLQIMWIMPDNIYLTAPYHGSRIIVHQNGTLEIRNVRPSDTAEFTCVARNDGGESMLVVQLEVIDILRRPMFKNPFNEKIIAKPGRMTIMNCFADGNPPPEIVWLLPNGTRFFNGQKLSKYHAGSNGTLIIYSPTKDDAGKYRCAARNKVGYIEKLIILEVGQMPTILTHPRGPIKNIIGEPLSLHCLSDGIPRPGVIWTLPSGYVIDRPQVNGKYRLLENGTLIIQETTVHDRGNYVCKAKNYAGEASITVPVMVVAYPPRITKKPPQNIHTRAGHPVHLNCIAIGIPKPEITWELPDLSLLSTASKGRPSGTELLHPQGTLVVQNPKSSDTGTYKCIAKNPLGTDTSSTYLKVI